MRHLNIRITVIFLALFLKWTLSVYYVPERADVTVVNEQYVYNVSSYVTRFGRKSPYYFNFVVGLKHVWGNNVTIHMAFFENVNNQYKSSFAELHLKLCDMMHYDQYFGKLLQIILTGYQVSCPVLPGIYQFVNITLPSDKLPNFLPFQKGKVEITYTQLLTKDIMLQMYTTFSVKNHLGKWKLN